MKIKVLIALLVALTGYLMTSNSVHSSNIQKNNADLNWDALIKPTKEIQNPFEDLSYENITLLREYAGFQDAIKTGDLDSDPKYSDYINNQVHKIADVLLDEGLDANKLYDLRNEMITLNEERFYTPNPKVLDKNWKLGGYMVPIDFEGLSVTKFFLVPIAGQCIHTPAPPANQIILVNYPEGIVMSSLEAPLFIEGTLQSELNIDQGNYYDGTNSVESIYHMTATNVAFLN
ncbi:MULTISPECIES: DUF3299 domain-containing protein [unclassified Vibrio]|uniref:DUF3299 domain-containing protein n=1 Tax=unclassified Vibrio TaxID=2614977 RepID=UPI00159D5B17|nr:MULTISPECIES: DUF3299 domain-containing protein [unclassified Vibrio]NVN83061.1 DUF3299 domain-containing protein [Vibrio sp. Scap16]QLE91779.1 DUF3299 domain-containing protein [Vibrio sp. Scap24]